MTTLVKAMDFHSFYLFLLNPYFFPKPKNGKSPPPNRRNSTMIKINISELKPSPGKSCFFSMFNLPPYSK